MQRRGEKEKRKLLMLFGLEKEREEGLRLRRDVFIHSCSAIAAYAGRGCTLRKAAPPSTSRVKCKQPGLKPDMYTRGKSA